MFKLNRGGWKLHCVHCGPIGSSYLRGAFSPWKRASNISRVFLGLALKMYQYRILPAAVLFNADARQPGRPFVILIVKKVLSSGGIVYIKTIAETVIV